MFQNCLNYLDITDEIIDIINNYNDVLNYSSPKFETKIIQLLDIISFINNKITVSNGLEYFDKLLDINVVHVSLNKITIDVKKLYQNEKSKITMPMIINLFCISLSDNHSDRNIIKYNKTIKYALFYKQAWFSCLATNRLSLHTYGYNCLGNCYLLNDFPINKIIKNKWDSSKLGCIETRKIDGNLTKLLMSFHSLDPGMIFEYLYIHFVTLFVAKIKFSNLQPDNIAFVINHVPRQYHIVHRKKSYYFYIPSSNNIQFVNINDYNFVKSQSIDQSVIDILDIKLNNFENKYEYNIVQQILNHKNICHLRNFVEIMSDLLPKKYLLHQNVDNAAHQYYLNLDDVSIKI